jgi:uncharacterized lipoprotein YehR (DUF1307 family)
MKKFVLIFLSVALFFIGCKSVNNSWRHFKSGVVGLSRTVTLYSNDGKVIKQWQGNFLIEDKGGTISWVGDDNKTVLISGTFTVEEK